MYKTRQNIQATLIPSEIVLNHNYDHGFPIDYGRAIMQNKILIFRESVEESFGTIENKQLQLNNMDAFILNIILDYLKKNERNLEKREMYISLPQFSSSFPILLTYHLLFNDLAYRIKPNENEFSKFERNDGILLVSHNVDLLQHVWYSSLNDISLREFFPTYIVKGEKFRVFNFNTDAKTSNVIKDDGTLPWIGFYRAHRKKLLDNLEKKPRVIILDLMPLYHRKRANELIRWAKEKAGHVVILLPSNDMNLKYVIQNSSMHYAINQSTAPIFENLLPFTISNLLYPSWGTSHSLKYLQPVGLNFEIREYAKVDKKLIVLLKQYESALNDCKKMNGILPDKYRKIDSLKLHMCNLIIPLSEYEKERRQEKLFNIFDQYTNYKRIPPQDSEEYSLDVNLAHHLYNAFDELYYALYESNYSQRGKLLLDTLQNNHFEKGLILIIDKYEKNSVVSYLSNFIDSKYEVLTYKEFNEMQLKNNYPVYDALFLTTPFPNKYLSGFNFTNSSINLISIFNDTYKYCKQIDSIFNNKRDLNSLLRTFSLNHKINIKEADLSKRALKINISKLGEYVLKEDVQEVVEVTDEINLNIFDDFRLLELLKSNRQYHLKINDLNAMRSKQDRALSTTAQLVELEDIEGNKERLFIPLEDYINVQRVNKNIIETLPISKAKLDDLWIRVNHDQRKDLFQEILNVASSTIIMRWISEGLTIWNEILNSVWKKFHRGQRFKKEIYEVIRKEINLNGGNVSSYYTISNWFKNINLVRDEENLKALIKISNKPEFIDSMRIVLSSISELRSIHIQLGRAISKIINIQSKRLLDYEDMDEWITIGENIVIPTEDISSLINIARVVDINSENRAFIPNELIYQNMSQETANEIIKTFTYKEEKINVEFVT
ncbi:DrmE family protein [Cytobacillus solani]|uniref:Uncharacterized protein n=1 Tax=Cytobacillus solani TaxID=1637975 RepID=A0A0Q3QLA0_9BACI|nr:DrmE family protein [Cytobacillus solani]KQL18400.1 hypothetical protein AN957_07330 [Cytobacillus solani]